MAANAALNFNGMQIEMRTRVKTELIELTWIADGLLTWIFSSSDVFPPVHHLQPKLTITEKEFQ